MLVFWIFLPLLLRGARKWGCVVHLHLGLLHRTGLTLFRRERVSGTKVSVQESLQWDSTECCLAWLCFLGGKALSRARPQSCFLPDGSTAHSSTQGGRARKEFVLLRVDSRGEIGTWEESYAKLLGPLWLRWNKKSHRWHFRIQPATYWVTCPHWTCGVTSLYESIV